MVTVNIKDGKAIYGDDVSEKEYGFDLTVNNAYANLYYNEKLSLTYKYDREVKDIGEYEILADNVYIDGAQVDPDNCNYDFTFINGTLTVTPRHIMLFIKESSCYYGEDRPTPEYTLEGLVEGDKLTRIEFHYFNRQDMTTVNNPKDADTYGVNITSLEINGKIVKTASEDENYYISVSANKFIIKPAPLKITFPEITGVTYGDEWAYPQGQTKVEGLKYNETLSFDVKFTDADGNPVETPKNAGAYEIAPDADTYAVKNEDDTEGLLSNYTLTVENGTLEIARRALSVKFTKEYCDTAWYDVYYGDDLPDPEFLIYEKGKEEVEYTLPYSETVTFGYRYLNLETNEYETPKNVGTYELQIAFVYINGEPQTNKSCNYTFSVDPPWLIIHQQEIELILQNFSQVYGETVSYRFYSNGKDGNGINRYGERVDIKVRYLKDGEEVTPRNVGDYDIEAVEYFVYDKNGKLIENGTDNYYFETDFGKMTITARPITITLSDCEITYGDMLELERRNPIFSDVEGVEHD
ncbi:MAG: hypothetical protein K2O67_01785, partial [Clostridia bacterium]|nr:hypothetical protein [Clostridia bacterium]